MLQKERKNRLWLPVFCLLALGLAHQPSLYAQDPAEIVDLFNPQPGRPAPVTNNPKAEIKPAWSPHIAIGIGAGTKGYLGAEVAANIISKLNVRLGYNHLDFSVSGITTTLGGQIDEEVKVQGEMRESNIELLAEWPVIGKSFRVVGGVSYTFSNKLGGSFQLAENYRLNDAVFTPEEVGYGGGTLFYSSKVAPYLGIGIGQTVPVKRVSLAIDIGAYYKGAPQVDIVATGIFRSNEINEPILNRNLKRDTLYHFWPVLAGKITVRIF